MSYMSQVVPCLLTVDVEDYFHVEAFSSVIDARDWPRYRARVEQNTLSLLDLFDRQGAKGTFFILGWVAERYPAVVRAIHERGHEVACHSHWHRLIYKLEREEFREDTRRAKSLLEQITGREVLGYRAPSFSIVKQSLWALEVLVQEGFRYDASIYPIHHDTYGIPDWSPAPQMVETASGPILEIPGCTVRLLGRNIPCGGGGYLRLLPMTFNLRALRQVLETPGRCGMIYIHPWEVDSGQPRIAAPLLSRFRHYTGLKRTERKLGRLLETFTMSRIADCLPQFQRTAEIAHAC